MSNISYVECPFCHDFKRKDKMVAHLATHKEQIIECMSVEQREGVLTRKKPFIYIRSGKGLQLLTCLYCKKGGISCSERSNIETVYNLPHKECIAAFDTYAPLYASKEPATPITIKWHEKEASVYKKEQDKEEPKAIVRSTEAKPEKAETKPTIPKTIEEMLLKTWATMEAERIAEEKELGMEPEDEEEPDLMGKLGDVLKHYQELKRILKKTRKTNETLRDEINVLEHDVKIAKGAKATPPSAPVLTDNDKRNLIFSAMKVHGADEKTTPKQKLSKMFATIKHTIEDYIKDYGEDDEGLKPVNISAYNYWLNKMNVEPIVKRILKE